ncbi:TPA: pyruvate kinase [Candidatus Ventrenecus stercoripullorum]|nr:pyruvate kinase [Candidatus Ventrenecus stercoripullorum]
MKKTKIVCSIGPASNTVPVMEKMVQAGMNVARINFSHATIEEREQAISTVREVRKKTGMNVAILWDTKGPEFRCGVMEGDGIDLVAGKTVRLVKESVVGTAERFSVNHPEAIDSLNPGDTVLLENAKMKLEVVSKEDDGVTCNIISGGHLGNRKSMSAPGVKLDIPFISDEDREDLIYACEHGGEFVALSFVNSKEDVLEAKELLKEHGREDLQIICKIESALGIQNLESILDVSDGIMVARGDLGTEIPSEVVPIEQKKMIKVCRRRNKICIVATEMLETMMENARPKRAETSDIANAVLDGTDAVMLSGETTVGKHPVETVEAMARICEVTEQYADYNYVEEMRFVVNARDAIATAVVDTANRLNAKLITTATVHGRTARLISNFRPKAPVLALTPSEKEGRKLMLNYGIYPVLMPLMNSTDEVLEHSVSEAKRFMDLSSGDIVVITGGFPNTDENRTTNLMKIEII